MATSCFILIHAKKFVVKVENLAVTEILMLQYLKQLKENTNIFSATFDWITKDEENSVKTKVTTNKSAVAFPSTAKKPYLWCVYVQKLVLYINTLTNTGWVDGNQHAGFGSKVDLHLHIGSFFCKWNAFFIVKVFAFYKWTYFSIKINIWILE